MVKFHQALSDRSVYLRYFHNAQLAERIAHQRLARVCLVDYENEVALLAERSAPEDNREILAVGRMSRIPGKNAAEIALLVRDQDQHHGLGSELLRRLVQVAGERLASLRAYILRENIEMQALVRKLGFRIVASEDPAVLQALLSLPRD